MRRLIDVSYIGARVCHAQWLGLCRSDYPDGVVIVDQMLSERQADDRAILEAAEAREHELGKDVARAKHLAAEDLLEALGR